MKWTLERSRTSGKTIFSRRGGYALLLGLLITIAIGMIIYYFSFYRPARKTQAMQVSRPDEFPWVNDWRIRGSGAVRPKGAEVFNPSPEQPQFTEAMFLRIKPQENNNSRGKVELTIASDGSIIGLWSANYKADNGYRYEVMGADLEGNTDATNRYKDDSGEDPAKLFFITTGNFIMIETDPRNRVKSVAGDIYVVGWIAPDLTAHGRLYLTTDRVECQRIFEWTGTVWKLSEVKF
ncbi:MAG: hypothetical protein JW709_01825 [Sedimentisphaerales bacterium]|nr:hypothetical protein [Sedimentisphaerales bacterium]